MKNPSTESTFVQPHIFWLYSDKEKIPDFDKIRRKLIDISTKCYVGSDQNLCVEFLLKTVTSKNAVYVIIDSKYSENLVSLAESLEHVRKIYVYSQQRPIWLNQFTKAKDNFYPTIEAVYERLTIDFKVSMDMYTKILFASQTDIESENRQDPSFMYHQLMKRIILHDIEEDKENLAKEEIIKYFREVNENSEEQLRIVDQFDAKFTPEKSINWYTKDCFLNRTLNRALWLPDPVGIYRMRYFIRHLHNQIVSKSEEGKHQPKPSMVYRGQSMSTEQLEGLKKQTGGFVSFNNFLSTTLYEYIAEHFAGMNLRSENEIAVVFKIKIDQNVKIFPFAEVVDVSDFEQEKEILFSIGTVFRLESVSHVTGKFWAIELKLSDDVDQKLAQFTQRMITRTCSTHPMISFIKLMEEMAQHKMIAEFDELSSKDDYLADNPRLAERLHHALGTGYLSAGNPRRAIVYFKLTLSSAFQRLPQNHPSLSATYNNLAACYAHVNDIEKALENYKIALDNQCNCEHPNSRSIVAYSINISQLYLKTKEYHDALKYSELTLEHQKKYLTDTDPFVCETYSRIAFIHKQLNDNQKAEFYQDKAKKIEKADIPHPDAVGRLSLTTGRRCLENEQYSEAIQHFHDALKEQEKYLLKNHESIAITYHLLASTYFKQEKYRESLLYYQKSLEIEMDSLPGDHPTIATSYENIANVHLRLSNYNEALDYLQRAIEQCRKRPYEKRAKLRSYLIEAGRLCNGMEKHTEAISLLEEAAKLADEDDQCNSKIVSLIHYQLGTAFCKSQSYQQGLSSYMRTLKNERKHLSDDHPTIAITLNKISETYHAMSNNEEALKYGNEAIEQLKKRSNPDQSVMVTCLENVGAILMTTKKLDEATNVYEKLITVSQGSTSNGNSAKSINYYRLAESHHRSKNYDKALKYYLQTLEIERQQLPDHHPTIATTLLKICEVQMRLGNIDEAIAYGTDGIAQSRKSLNVNGQVQIGLRLSLGKAFELKNNHQESAKHFEEAFTLIEKLSACDHETLETLAFKIGTMYFRLNQFEKAIYFDKKVLQFKLLHVPINNQEISDLYNMIAKLLFEVGRFDKALTAVVNSKNHLLQCTSYNRRKLDALNQLNKTIKDILNI